MYLILAKNRENPALQLIHSEFCKWLLLLVCAAISTLMFGCARLPVKAVAPNDTGGKRITALRGIEEWAVSGRLAFSDGEHGGTLRFDWNAEPQATSMTFKAPMAQGQWCLHVDRGGAELRDADGRIQRNASARTLLRSRLGWDVPLPRLRYWIKAIPADGDGLVTDSAGLPATISGAGWTVEYSHYRRIAGIMLPGKLKLKRSKLRLNIILGSWTIKSPIKALKSSTCA